MEVRSNDEIPCRRMSGGAPFYRGCETGHFSVIIGYFAVGTFSAHTASGPRLTAWQ